VENCTPNDVVRRELAANTIAALVHGDTFWARLVLHADRRYGDF
jgi:hypothetical protein